MDPSTPPAPHEAMLASLNPSLPVSTIPLPTSPDYDVPILKYSHNHAGCGHKTTLTSFATKTPLGATIKSAAQAFSAFLASNPPLEDVQTVLNSWSSAGASSDDSSKIPEMVMVWFETHKPTRVVAQKRRLDLVRELVSRGFKLRGSAVWELMKMARETEEVGVLDFVVGEMGWDVEKMVGVKGPMLAHLTPSLHLTTHALSFGASPNTPFPANFHYTPLHAAAAEGPLPVWHALLAAGASITPPSPSSGVLAAAATTHSASNDRRPVMQLLLDHGADVNATHQIVPAGRPEGEELHVDWLVGLLTPLLVAVGKGDRELVEWLLERGADVRVSGVGAVTGFKMMGVVELAEKHGYVELKQVLEERIEEVGGGRGDGGAFVGEEGGGWLSWRGLR